MSTGMNYCDLSMSAERPLDVSKVLRSRLGDYLLEADADGTAGMAEVQFREFGEHSLSLIQFGSPVQLHSRTQEKCIHLQVLLAGNCRWFSQQFDRQFSAGDCFIVNPALRSTMKYSADCRKLIAKIPNRSLISSLISIGFALPPNELAFSFSAQKIEQLPSLHHLITDIFFDEMNANLPANIIRSFNNLLNYEVIRRFYLSSEKCVETTWENAVVDGLRQQVIQSPAEDYCSATLARLAGVSQKTLYNLFHREVGVTPTEFVRRLKLEAAYVRFKTDVKVKTVTEVAMNLGFTNLSRFSHYYSELFGEKPSQTIRQRVLN